MRTSIVLVFILFTLSTFKTAYGQTTICEPHMYYDPAAPNSFYLVNLPTPWFGIRMSTEWVSTVDSAYFGFGINRATPSGQRDTLEIRVLANTLPAITHLDHVNFVLTPNISGKFVDAYYVVEFIFDSPVAWVNGPADFWLSWRIRGTSSDQARIMVKKQAIEPERSVIINQNGSTILATDFMRSQLGLAAKDSVDLVAEARLCYPNGIPVELISLNAASHHSAVLLSWETATETNNHGFEVLRLTPSEQTNLNLWERIAFIPGYGTSTQKQRYFYTDVNADLAADAKGFVRYRLRQLDYDGTTEYSPVVEVKLETAAAEYHLFQNYPNPAKSDGSPVMFSFSLPEEQHVRLEVVDVLGRIVSVPVNGVYSAGKHSHQTILTDIRPGMYYYRLHSTSGMLTKSMLVSE